MEPGALPRDPMLLLSVVNTRLRDRYEDLEQLCDDLEADRESLEAALAAVGYRYDPGLNQFRS